MPSSGASSQFKLPRLGSSKPVVTGGFVLPKLGNVSVNESSSSSTSLSDFAKAQLNSYVPSDGSRKSVFAIPKLFPSEPKVNSSVELKTEPTKVLIDLKCALVSEMEQKTIASVPKAKVKENVEVFIPQFIDCDNTFDSGSKDFVLDDLCERVTLKELKSRYRNLSFKKFSSVGKIIRYKFKKSVTPVQHVQQPKHLIQPFAFDTLSPDDKILAHLNKNRK